MATIATMRLVDKIFALQIMMMAAMHCWRTPSVYARLHVAAQLRDFASVNVTQTRIYYLNHLIVVQMAEGKLYYHLLCDCIVVSCVDLPNRYHVMQSTMSMCKHVVNPSTHFD